MTGPRDLPYTLPRPTNLLRLLKVPCLQPMAVGTQEQQVQRLLETRKMKMLLIPELVEAICQ